MSAAIWSLSFFWAAAALARAALAAALLRSMAAYVRFCEASAAAVRFSSCLSAALLALSSRRLWSRARFWAAVCLAQVVRLGARVLGRLVERGERGLVLRDLVGERLVLLADVDVVAHLGEHVGERAARQEGLEERRPIGVVGAPQALGEELLADRQVGLLGDLLGLDDDQVGVERLELDDEVVVVAPDHVDLGFHRGDLDLDRGEVGVDALEDAGRVLDLLRRARPGGPSAWRPSPPGRPCPS